MPETVWAIHNFEAEAEDEISFHIGEPIIVLHRDELYQDGWWEGTNIRNETGLFPQNYTTQNPPEQALSEPPVSRDATVYGADTNNAVASNSNNGNTNKHGSNAPYSNSNLGHISNSANHNSHSNHTHDSSSSSRIVAQQSQVNLNSGINNMHIHQNPDIASPPMGSTRSGFSGSAHSSTNMPNSKVIAHSVEESLNDPQLAGHPTSWSIDQVAYWLRWCGFSSVVPSFVGKGPYTVRL
ncbi:hypothetical protein EDD21DRAFT_241653 [Dissophora ornata]|nr:hypothetical protein EDD21DRAFT_241653 [Dissophora ornata]